VAATARAACGTSDEPRAVAAGRDTSVGTILLADPDAAGCGKLKDALAGRGYVVRCVRDGQAVLDGLEREGFDVVVLDQELPKVSGLNVLGALPALRTDAKFIVVATRGSVESAVEAIKAGATEYLERPVDESRVARVVDRALEELSVSREVARVRRSASEKGLSAIVGRTPAMQKVFRLVERVAPTRANVLVTGETGTGKDLVARAVHDLSPRSTGPFIAVNCSAIPSTLLEAELFGHTRGSFTGAVQSRKGLIEEAAGGTLFLDEISTLSEDVQVKLLRVLQERVVERVGDNRPRPVDVRVVSATNRDLETLLASGRMREDFFYRIKVVSLTIPPLRDRREDIPLLITHLLEKIAGREGRTAPPVVSADAMSLLMNHGWPGNVRELENALEHALVLSRGGAVRAEHLPPELSAHATPIRRDIDEVPKHSDEERAMIAAALTATGWNRSRAARNLGINRTTLWRKIREYGLEPDEPAR